MNVKRYFLAVCLAAGLSSAVFSSEEQWVTMGFEFGNYFENDSKDREFMYMASPGFNVSVFSFLESKTVGLFFYVSFLFPLLEINYKKDYDYVMLCDWIVGPGFKYDFSDKLKLHFGAGLGFMWPLYMEHDAEENKINYIVNNTNMGIGADMGLKLDISDTVFIDFGLTCTYALVNFSSLYFYSSDDKHVTLRYSMVGVKPYIGIGLNFYREGGTKWGKPKQ